MLLAHVADLHIDERKGDSGESLDEQVERLLWIGGDAHGAGATAMVVAGDIFDHLSSPAERNAAIQVFATWAERMPVVAVYGNHDRPGDLDYLARLRTHHAVVVADRPDIVASGPTIAVLPWPRKAWLAARLEAGQDVGQVATEAMRAILSGFAVRLAKIDGPRILVAHAELGAALTDSGQPLVGKADLDLSEGDLLDSGADYVALGHIHKHQILGDGRICYAGAPRQTTFGEDAVKGYCLVDVRRGEVPVIEHRRAPGRELITITGSWDGETVDFDLPPAYGNDPGAIPESALVRIKYETPEDARAAAREAAERFVAALSPRAVQIDPRIITTHRVRSEEIRTARTNADRVEALWGSRGQRPARASEILAKLSTLESEVQP